VPKPRAPETRGRSLAARVRLFELTSPLLSWNDQLCELAFEQRLGAPLACVSRQRRENAEPDSRESSSGAQALVPPAWRAQSIAGGQPRARVAYDASAGSMTRPGLRSAGRAAGTAAGRLGVFSAQPTHRAIVTAGRG